MAGTGRALGRRSAEPDNRIRVVVAPDSFKGSLGAAGVAEAVVEGWRSTRADDHLDIRPQADGGEGTLDAISTAVEGARFRSAGWVTGPDGRMVEGKWLELDDGTAVLELAQCSGLPLMKELDPLGATTRGLGEVIVAALEAGATSLVIGLGGSASTDGGVGAIDALAGREPPVGGVRLLTDVSAPLLGPSGAATVFGPQKGASALEVAQLETRLAALANRLGGDPNIPGAGAAGGAAYGLSAVWGATIESGSAALSALTGLDDAILEGDLLITGEGRFDATSLTGKVVGNALSLARAASTSAAVIAGSIAVPRDSPHLRSVSTLALVELAGSLEGSLADPAGWLRRAGALAALRIASERGEVG